MPGVRYEKKRLHQTYEQNKRVNQFSEDKWFAYMKNSSRSLRKSTTGWSWA